MDIGSVGSAHPAFGISAPDRTPPAPPREALDGAARTLRMDPFELRAELAGGATLSGLGTARGVSREALVSAVAEGLTVGAAAPSQGADMLSAAVEMVDGRPSASQAPAPLEPSVAGAREDVEATFGELADEIGIDRETLLAQVRSGDASSLARLSSSYGGTTQATSGLLVDTRA